MPLSGEAAQADRTKKRRREVDRAHFSERKTRADLLLKANATMMPQTCIGAWSKMPIRAYVPPSSWLWPAPSSAVGMPRMPSAPWIPFPTPSQLNAERHLTGASWLAPPTMTRASPILGQLRQTAPASPWLEQDLLVAGNIYLLKPDPDHAIDCYRELQQRFPNASRT